MSASGYLLIDTSKQNYQNITFMFNGVFKSDKISKKTMWSVSIYLMLIEKIAPI